VPLQIFTPGTIIYLSVSPSSTGVASAVASSTACSLELMPVTLSLTAAHSSAVGVAVAIASICACRLDTSVATAVILASAVSRETVS